MGIKKYICKKHNLITTRKGMRKHLGELHARNNFKSSEIKDGKGTWSRENFT